MKKIILSVLSLFFVFLSIAQNINVNPDPNGEPWIVGGLRVPSIQEINKIPVVKYSADYKAKDLPAAIDNSTNSYFRPIFSQTGGCCAQASGVGYNFTYEINRVRGTSANLTQNQFPTHYTYDFLNGGDDANGSWMADGWAIIKANGCPTVETYGGLAISPQYWMSGYDNYSSGMNNRVSETLAFDVSTPDGLEILKYWMYDHLDGSETGSIVNFAAGISNDGFQMSGDKVISWGYPVNHAMTITGWDDNITYDFNNDGNITNDIDINSDGVVDMKDWERGALVMVNSWGTSWGNGGKAYIMYKLLAEEADNGGIHAKKTFSINVKNNPEPELYLKVKMQHNSRNAIKIYAGISPNVADVEPEFILNFPLFNKQGGSYDMRGNNSDPIEITLDISELLSYIEPNVNSKYFLMISEDDESGFFSGQVIDFSITDNENNEIICDEHNVSIINNYVTTLSLVKAHDFDAPEVTDEQLPVATVSQSYSHQLSGTGGTQPYTWNVKIDYEQAEFTEAYPNITSNVITTSDNDDGFAAKTLDFNFPFFGELYNQIFLTTDGSIVFEPSFDYLRTEDAIIDNKVISVFASDLMIYPANGDGIFYEGDANSATFRWKTSLYGDESANIDVAVKLFPSGEIKMYYGDNISEGISWASGISNGVGSYIISPNSNNNNPNNDRFNYTPNDYPYGMTMSQNGIFSGIAPDIENSWDINFLLKDDNNIFIVKTLTFTTETANIENLNKENNIDCFPNPFSNEINFYINNSNKATVTLEIYNLTGVIVYKKTKSNTNNTFSWNPETNIPSGIYMYKIFSETKNLANGKIIKK